MFLVNKIEIKLVVHDQTGTRYGLPGCFRDLLACPVLRHVTVKFGLLRIGLYYDTNAEWSHMSEDRVLDKKNSDGLDEILTLTSGMYRQLKEKIGEELKFETNYLRVGEKTRLGKSAWAKLQSSKLESWCWKGKIYRNTRVLSKASSYCLSWLRAIMSPRSVKSRRLVQSNARMTGVTFQSRQRSSRL